MSIRDKLLVFFVNLAVAIVVGLLARYGIHIDIPPIKVEYVPPPQRPNDGKDVPPKEREAKPDIHNAICQIRTSVGGCSAVIIGPRRADGRYHVLSAAHCVKGINDRFTLRTKQGHVIGCTVYRVDNKADICWAITDTSTTVLPYAVLAQANPIVGKRIAHSGYGVDKPGNTEYGEILSDCQSNGRMRMRLSVSSGDSGGAIYDVNTGEVYSVVCCTVSDGRIVWTEGPCTTIIIERMLYDENVDDAKPVPIPEEKLFRENP